MEHLEPVVDDDQDYQDWDQDSDFEEVEEDDALDGSFGQDDLNNADETVILGKVTKLLNKIRSFSKFCRKSTRIADAVSKLTGEDGLNYKRFLVDFHVRWNTTYLMLQRFLEMKNIVVSLTCPVDVLQFDFSDTQIEKLKKFKFTQSEINLAEILCTVLKPFFTATKMLSGKDYPTLASSKVVEIILFNHFSNLKQDPSSRVTQALATMLYDSFEKYFDTKVSLEQKNTCLVFNSF